MPIFQIYPLLQLKRPLEKFGMAVANRRGGRKAPAGMMEILGLVWAIWRLAAAPKTVRADP